MQKYIRFRGYIYKLLTFEEALECWEKSDVFSFTVTFKEFEL